MTKWERYLSAHKLCNQLNMQNSQDVGPYVDVVNLGLMAGGLPKLSYSSLGQFSVDMQGFGEPGPREYQEWYDVTSTAVARLRHDAKSRTLYAIFVKGACYGYREVPVDIFEQLIGMAHGLGNTFDTLIKKGGFEYFQVPDPAAAGLL